MAEVAEKFDEGVFQEWYKMWAGRLDLNPDSDDPRHHYDYRAAYMAGAEPQPNFEDRKFHWPSQFKTDDHPNRYVNGMDTKTGEPQKGTDEFGGIETAETEIETDEFGGEVFNPPTDQKWEKPLPLGQRLIDKYARPSLQGIGSAAGIILGGGTGSAAGTAVAPGPGTATGALAGAVAGESLGYAIGDEIADLLQEWFGYYEPLPIMMNLQEAGENIREGATYAMGGYAAGPTVKAAWKGGNIGGNVFGKKIPEKKIPGIKNIPGVGRAANWVSSMFPKTKGQAKEAAGEVLSAFTNKGPIVAKNIEEAQAIEELIGGGFKFDLGQLTGDANIVKFMREGIDDAGDLAVAQAEQSAINTRAINDFIKKTKGKGTAKDFLKPLSTKEELLAEAETIAKRNLEKQQVAREGQIGPIDVGTTIRGEMEAGELAAREAASEKFAAVPEQEQIVDDLYDGFQNIMKPKYRSEGTDKFPKVLQREIKAIKDSIKGGKRDATSQAVDIADSKKYSAKQARAKHDVFVKKADVLLKAGKHDEAMEVAMKGQSWREAAEILEGTWKGDPTAARATRGAGEPTMSLKDIQGLRSEILEDLRTAKDKGLPRSLRARLAKAVELIDQKLGGAGGKPKITDRPKLTAAVKDPKTGKIYKGPGIHADVRAKMFDDGVIGPGKKDAFAMENGFVTEKGEWLTRKGAKKFFGKDTAEEIDKLSNLSSKQIEKLYGSYIARLNEITKGKTPSQELQAAQKFFRKEVIEKYGKGSVGKVLRGEESVQDAIVAGNFFKTGPAGEQAATEFMNIMGDNVAAKTALKEHINQKVYDLQSDKTGEITKAALNRFLKLHRPALKKLGMENEFNTLMKAREAADKALAVSKDFEKSVASRALNADVNEVVKKAFSGTGSKKEAAEDLIEFMKRPKPSRDELLYHATDETIPPGELISGYFGGFHHLENDMLSAYGDNIHSLKLPKGTKILDLTDIYTGSGNSEDAWRFMEDYIAIPETKAGEIFTVGGKPIPTMSKKKMLEMINARDPQVWDEFESYFMDTWTIPEKLKLVKEMGYDGLSASHVDEYLIPEKLIKKSQAFNAKTLKPVTGKSKPVKTADLYGKDEWGEVLLPESKGKYVDPKAIAGLQNAMVDEILTEIPLDKPMRDLLTSDKMAAQFRKYDAALKVVFKDSPEKLKAMHTVRKAVKALEYKTGQTAGEGERYAADIVRRLAFLRGHSTVAAADIARKTVRVLKGISKEKIHKYINRGILDPQVAWELKRIASGGSEKKITQGVTNSLVRLGLISQPKKKEIDQWFTTRKGKH